MKRAAAAFKAAVLSAAFLIAAPVSYEGGAARAGAPAPFTLEEIATGAVAGNPIRHDASGRLHLAWVDQGIGMYRYAVRTGNGWTVENIGPVSHGAFNIDLALDSNGIPHVTYLDSDLSTFYHVEYATRPSGSWVFETVDLDGIPRTIAIGPGDVPFISFERQRNAQLGVAERTGGSWSVDTPPVDVDDLGPQSLAVDPLGRVHLAWLAPFGGVQDLVYAIRQAGVWATIEEPDTGNLEDPRLALDDQSIARIAYTDNDAGEILYADRSSGTFVIETVRSTPDDQLTLALDDGGDPHVGYLTGQKLGYSVRRAGSWIHQVVDPGPFTGFAPSLSLDLHGNPAIAYVTGDVSALLVADASVGLVSPLGGETLAVGDTETIVWRGDGPVDVQVSPDGGATFHSLLFGVSGAPRADGLRQTDLLVPHVPSAFARLRIVRSSPLSISTSGLVRIEGSIALLRLSARVTARGVELSWETDPGPDRIAGYRIERRRGGAAWSTIVARTSERTLVDAGGRPGDRYRLTAVNGLGDAYLLGERVASSLPAAGIAARPLPYRAGSLSVTFASAGSLGGGPGPVRLSLYDVAGRLVRMLVQDVRPAGVHTTSWDGSDADGREVPSGTYLLELTSAGQRRTERITVVR